MKLKHVDVLVQTMEVGMSEQMCSGWKGDRRNYGEVHKIWKPLLLGPIRSYQHQQCPLAGAKFVEDLPDERKRREGIRLKAIPALKECIRPRCHGVIQRGEVDQSGSDPGFFEGAGGGGGLCREVGQLGVVGIGECSEPLQLGVLGW